MDTIQDITDFTETTISFDPEIITNFVARPERRKSSVAVGNSHRGKHTGRFSCLVRFGEAFFKLFGKIMGSNGTPSEEDKYEYYDYRRRIAFRYSISTQHNPT